MSAYRRSPPKIPLFPKDVENARQPSARGVDWAFSTISVDRRNFRAYPNIDPSVLNINVYIDHFLASDLSTAGKVSVLPPPRSNSSDDERRPVLTTGRVDISSSPIQDDPAPRPTIPSPCKLSDLGCRLRGSTKNPSKDFETRFMRDESSVFPDGSVNLWDRQRGH